ncbi:NAD-dependent epimerase/dehydratase family protein [Agromyces luteolus]|uniref:NAD-dependent epimerase/dehydratase family protein n=2 Tax=Agromyces luteolus TaxID=88373 RepID=A0A7C9HJZ9_9MICO|nr:NAD(P)-dependent oxidoreductase [Agromyces luteolus]MUN08983.1 NAD-dependent epimerase/dehydratase family protein [Agromyces luteolus]
MRICVTGASGLAGRAVVADLLDHGYEVLATDVTPPSPLLPARWSRPDLVYTQADLTDFGDAIEVLSGVDAVAHLAAIPAPSIFTPARTLNVNNAVNSNVFLAAAQLGLEKVVWASSETTLGLDFGPDAPPDYLPLDEDHYPKPTSTYSLSKVLGETMAEHVSDWTGIPFIALRFSNVIDPARYDEFPGFEQDPASRLFNAFGYIDVRDAAQSVRRALEADVDGARAYVIANADSVMTRPTRDLIEEFFPGVPLKEEFEGNASLFSIERARDELGFEPEFGWREGRS